MESNIASHMNMTLGDIVKTWNLLAHQEKSSIH